MATTFSFPTISSSFSFCPAFVQFAKRARFGGQHSTDAGHFGPNYDLFPAAYTALLTNNQAHLVIFDTATFVIAADDCASQTCTPHTSNLYEYRAMDGLLNGIGSAPVTHQGSAKFVYTDNSGNDITINNNNILICPTLNQ